MNIYEAIHIIEEQIPNPSVGLPEDIFLFISRITPMINVDLLIKDERGRTLLAWRDDQYSGRGWHLPGGIIRYKETMEDRIKKVAESEIGTIVKFDPQPVAINQTICSHKTRGHFISILYRCFLSSDFFPENKGMLGTDVGYLMWHNDCPGDLLKLQEIYKPYI